MNKRQLLQVLVNVVSIYVVIVVTWYLAMLLTGHVIDAEGGALLQSTYAPLAALLILTVIYILSLLEKDVRSLPFVSGATLLTQLATFLMWSPDSVLPIEYILGIHLLAIGALFAGLMVWKKRKGV